MSLIMRWIWLPVTSTRGIFTRHDVTIEVTSYEGDMHEGDIYLGKIYVGNIVVDKFDDLTKISEIKLNELYHSLKKSLNKAE